MRYALCYILFTIVFCLASSAVYAADNENKVLNRFLYSKNLHDRQEAFNIIVANKEKYKDNVLIELNEHLTKPDNMPDALIYLAAFIRDQRYLRPLTKLISDVNYSDSHCIYDCPIVFSLVIFGSFTNYSLPPLDNNIEAVKDLRSDTRWVKGISIKPEKASKYASGPGVDQLFSQLETLPLGDVIALAGPNTKDDNKRSAAAIVLQAHVTDDKYLKELYWLAIVDLPNDCSAEYRSSIHWAIYRAETFKKMNTR